MHYPIHIKNMRQNSYTRDDIDAYLTTAHTVSDILQDLTKCSCQNKCIRLLNKKFNFFEQGAKLNNCTPDEFKNQILSDWELAVIDLQFYFDDEKLSPYIYFKLTNNWYIPKTSWGNVLHNEVKRIYHDKTM